DGKDGQSKEMDGEGLPPDALAALDELDKELSTIAPSRGVAPKGEGKYDTSERDTEREQVDKLMG
ncbi:hypothetical protein HF288_12780, partial [Acidithiobacillus caldus]